MLSASTSKRDIATTCDFNAMISDLLTTRDALKIESGIGAVAMQTKVPREARVRAIESIFDRQGQFNNVAIFCLHQLLTLDESATRNIARRIVEQPLGEDREYVYASAISHLLEIGVESRDVPVIAAFLSHPHPVVRGACQRGLRSMYSEPREQLQRLAAKHTSEAVGPLRLFLAALPPALRKTDCERDEVQPRHRDAGKEKVTQKPKAARPKVITLSPAEMAAEMRGADRSEPSLKTPSKPVAPAEPVRAMPRQAETRGIAKARREAAKKDSVIPGDQGVMQGLRNPGLAGLPLEALRQLISAEKSVKEFVSLMAELAAQAGVDQAKMHSDRLIWFLSDEGSKNDEGLRKLAHAVFARR